MHRETLMTFDLESIKTTILEATKNRVPGILAGVAVFVVGWIVAKTLRGVIVAMMRKAGWEETIIGFLSNLAYMLLMTFVIITALGQAGVETNSFTAIIAAAGLAIGFALQGSLGNFSSGVMLVSFRPYKVGDVVEAAGVVGKVNSIQIFNTIMTTPDNKRIVVPNSAVMGGNITNYSAMPTRRVDMVFGIGYEDDIDKARALIVKELDSHPKVLKDPEWVVAVNELADSSVNFVVRPWCNTPDYWDVHNDLMESIKKSFDANGISIPYPQRDVHVLTDQAVKVISAGDSENRAG